MKKNIKAFIPYITVIFVVLLIAVAVNSFIHFVAMRDFHKLADNQALIQAFENQNTGQIEKIAAANNLVYQHFKQGKLITETKSDLPESKLIFYNNVAGSAVLKASTSQLLKSTNPYILRLGYSLYIMFPLCHMQCSQDTYLIYSRIMP